MSENPAAKNHYVDNEKLLQAMTEHRAKVQQSKKDNTPHPQVPNYIGTCMLLIAQRFSYGPSFVNYPYREELVSDGVENCIRYIDNFDPAKSDNPFAYFTQIIYFAFLRRIQKEKKQLYIKHKIFKNSMVTNDFAEFDGEDFDISAPTMTIENENMNDFIVKYEENLDKKRKKRKNQGIEKFFEVEEPELQDE